MSLPGGVPAGEGAPGEDPAERPPDPFDPRLARGASGALAQFNRAAVLSAADVHVASRLGALAGVEDEAVLLAVALAVRAPRIGHVLVDLERIRETVAVDGEEPVDLESLAWPEPEEWARALADSPLIADEATGEPAADTEGPARTEDGQDAEAAVRPLRRRGSWLYLDRYWAEEVTVAGALRERLAGADVAVDAERLEAGVRRLFAEPDGPQAEAARAALRRPLTVIAGGPGTGKTTTVARILALAHEQPGPAPRVALAAPTGKAAARLEESVHGAAEELELAPEVARALRAARASTIHRLLGWRPGSSSRFRHDRDDRLPHDVVVVDETSMVSLSLMARLIEAMRPGARLVLVGDPGQLASIEAGAVLGDIVGEDAGVRRPGIVVLARGHRYGGGIAELASAIRSGDDDAVMEVLGAGHEDVRWIDADAGRGEAPARVRTAALESAREILHAARADDGQAALRALGGFRLLCAHRRGPYGAAHWNARVEAWLADAEPGFATAERWYVGRPLLVTENDAELGVYNGDTGVVLDAGEGRVAAAFPRGRELVRHSPSRLGAVDTVYAMTIHKSQGSQFDGVAVLLPEPRSRILTRELLYTGVTRARTSLLVIGPEAAIRAAVARRVARASGLGVRLWGEAGTGAR